MVMQYITHFACAPIFPVIFFKDFSCYIWYKIIASGICQQTIACVSLFIGITFGNWNARTILL